ncbi:MOSC domain protein [Teratosphaeria destructans]|uniref:MOSC domain protein n=1 Tax=Teratosphaeria destructans TaxID=418781 RepID=A0A9W7W1L0_9PEZI|nr:MOSC domain protein [Teratosphaeria destructans]
MAKFRPNIVVSGAAEAWEEDFWAELTIGGDGGVVVYCEQNCGRCKSINIDYETGAAVAPGEAGRVLRVLSRDRRVDPGTKWSPVFGRYAFLDAASEGARIAVGDEVVVRRRNEERSVFDWEGLCTK